MSNNKFLRDKSINNLKNDLHILFKKKFSLRMQLSLNRIKKNHLIRECKKNISIIKTILREKCINDKKK